MADYKRMVSYMYQYENGVKKRNVGFARVEAKNGQCKITLHMQLLGQSDSIFPTYLIHREDNHMELIYLGDSLLKNQVMDSKLTADEANIMGTGYRLSDMGGLLIFLNNNIFFATEWDDKPITANEVLEALKPRGKSPIEAPSPVKPESTGENNIKTEPFPEKQDNPLQKNKSETKSNPEVKLVSASKEVTENIPQPLSLEEELKIPKYKLPRGWKTVEMFQRPVAAAEQGQRRYADNFFRLKANRSSEYYENQNKQDIKQSDGIGQEEPQKLEDRIVKDYCPQGGETGKNNSPKQGETLQDETLQGGQGGKLQGEKLQNEKLQGTVQQESGSSSEDLKAASLVLDMEQEDPPAAKRFFEDYPRIYPFEDNEILLCTKIEPKDIGLLPKELWALSSNSFLMHGFYCYHHLIFAKKKEGGSSCYVLGIPGIYHNREQFMARMFGFERFKSIRKRDLRQGDFGYWYIPVNF